MKRKYFFLSILSAGLLILSNIFLYGCKSDKEPEDNEIQIEYKADIFIDINETIASNAGINHDSIYYAISSQNSYSVIEYDLKKQSETLIPLDPFNGQINKVSVSDSYIALIVVQSNSSDFTYMFYLFDKTGAYIAGYDISDWNDGSWPMEVYADSQYVLAAINNTLLKFDVNGRLNDVLHVNGEIKHIDKFDISESYILSEDHGNINLYTFDAVNGNLSLKVHCPIEKDDAYSAFYSFQDDLLYLGNDTGVVQYNINNQQRVKLFEWTDLGFVVNYIESVFLYENTVYVCGKNILNYKPTIWKVTETETSEQMQQKTKIVVSYMEDGTNMVPKAAIVFNSLSSRYDVECIEYASSNKASNHEELISKYDLDIISGNIGDVLIMNNTTDYIKYASKGAFINLYDIADPEFSYESMFNCAVEPYEIHDSLYVMIPGFKVSTLILKTVNVPDGLWNIEKFVDMALSSGKRGNLIEGLSREKMLKTFLPYGINEYYDLDARKCKFESQSFEELLNFLYGLPVQSDDMKDDHDIIPYINDDIRLYEERNLESFVDFLTLQARFGFEDISVIGYPSVNGGVSEIIPSYYTAISSKSENISGAWEFIKFLLYSDCMLNAERGMRNIPSFKKVFSEWAEHEEMLYYYFIPNTLRYRVYLESAADLNDNKNKIEKRIDSETISKFENFLDSIGSIPNVPEPIQAIVTEELDAFFNNVRNAKETAHIIQNRVSIYMNEIS